MSATIKLTVNYSTHVQADHPASLQKTVFLHDTIRIIHSKLEMGSKDSQREIRHSLFPHINMLPYFVLHEYYLLAC